MEVLMCTKSKFIVLFSALIFLLACSFSYAENPFEQQLSKLFDELQGKKVALLTNPTGVDDQFQFIADRMIADGSVELVAFFAPEHGLRGDQQAGGGVTDYIDPISGLPVYSLYGSRKTPTDEQLAGLDVLMFDIQDVGVRFYTYVWTMTYAMEAAAKNGLEFIVFDRPNPIGCDQVQGAPIPFDAGLVGRKWPSAPFGVSTRHGMTVGEIATLVNEEWLDPKVDLQVITIPGYSRTMSFTETGYPWVIPSPNMPTIDTATVYPGTCVFEGANLSEGRGTTRPFEFIGAPFMNAFEYAEALNDLQLPGVSFRAAYFTPTFDDHSGQRCGGVQVHMTDIAVFEPIPTGLHMLKTACELYPEDVTLRSYVSTLMGVRNLHEDIWNHSVDSVISQWQDDLEQFKILREKHLLYPEVSRTGHWSVK